MSEGLKKLGEKLRGKREEMNLSLKEVENATSIRTMYLQAIEEGKVEHFLSNVYALGFIRQYANFLGFEQEKLSKEFPDAMRLPPEKQDFAYGIGTLEMRGSPHGGVRWMPNLVWGGLFLIVAICAWYFAKFVGIF
jgi:cytoskeletal protein RodZ